MGLSKRAEFLCKYCNIKQNSSVAWLDYVVVDRAGEKIKLEDFKDSYAVGGIDLSQTTDLTAASVIIERGGVLYAFTQFFMPANRLETAQAWTACRMIFSSSKDREAVRRKSRRLQGRLRMVFYFGISTEFIS